MSTHEDIDAHLENMQKAAHTFLDQSHYRSSFERFGEIRRLSKSEGRVMPHIWSTFFQMDQSSYLHEYETMAERAVELIALLESEERARQIQANLPEHEYEFAQTNSLPCAYENLAEATGMLHGYNSEGMHACIADGLAICRQTGKMRCIACFREYACDVYMAADDLDIARHQCQLVIDNPGPWSDRGDRRWLAAAKAARIELLRGRREEALALTEKAVEFSTAETVTHPSEVRLRVLFHIIPLRLAAGQPATEELEKMEALLTPRGECPHFDFEADGIRSLVAALAGDYAAAAELLAPWDQQLHQRKGLSDWFEVRLRMIALARLSGDMKKAERLTKPLEAAAQAGCDWLTIRRLERLLDARQTVSPLATLQDFGAGGAAPHIAAAATTEAAPVAAAAEEAPPAETEKTPLWDELEQLGEKLHAAFQDPNEEVFAGLDAAMLAIAPQRATHVEDAGRLVYLATFFPHFERAREVWQWANAIGAQHRDDPPTISVLARLGSQVRQQDESLAETITNERLEEMFRHSLRLDSKRANNFLRAGDFFAEINNYGEAERCYARAFRLDRTSSRFVIPLAGVYRATDRPKDALEVLDMALREGCDDPQVAWEAGILACMVGEYASSLLYLDRYQRDMKEPQEWVNYYRAISLLELHRPEECLAAMAAEAELAGRPVWHVVALRASALGQLGRAEEVAAAIDELFTMPLRDIDYLTPLGIEQNYARVRQHTHALLDARRARELDSRLLAANMMPEGYFGELRTQVVNEREVHFYRCLVRQPLDERWRTSEGCLFGQEEWTEYLAEWAALAETEEDAHAMVLQWQAKCFPLPAEVVQTQDDTTTYNDTPGVVWQGARFGGNPEETPPEEEA